MQNTKYEIAKAYLDSEIYCIETKYAILDPEKFDSVLQEIFVNGYASYEHMHLDSEGVLQIVFKSEYSNILPKYEKEYDKFMYAKILRDSSILIVFDVKKEDSPRCNPCIPSLEWIKEKIKTKQENEIRFNKMVIDGNLVIPVKDISMKLFANNTITIDYKG